MQLPLQRPCFAVIFSSLRSAEDPDGYAATATEMEELARAQPGFLGLESARDASGFGITVSYWGSLEDIERWRTNAWHAMAQRLGQTTWYRRYHMVVAAVERDMSYPAHPGRPEGAFRGW